MTKLRLGVHSLRQPAQQALGSSGRKRERARARETRVSPSRAPVFSCATTSKRLLRRLSLRIQTGKYENKGASIPVEEKLCLVCRRNYIENEKHFLMLLNMEYDNLRQKLYLHISENDTNFDTNLVNLTDHDRT